MTNIDHIDPEFSRKILLDISLNEPFYFHYTGHDSIGDHKNTFDVLNFFIDMDLVQHQRDPLNALGGIGEKIFYVKLTEEGRKVLAELVT